MENMDCKIELFCIKCDNCGHCEIIENIDNDTIAEILSNGGWVIKQVAGKWRDFCKDICREEYIMIMR